jgi:cysteine-rich repeat protein
MRVCFALALSACSAGRQPLRSNNLPDAAVTTGIPDGAMVFDDRPNHDDIVEDTPCVYGPTCKTARVPCGDGRITGQEECDDGNATSRDGCSVECTLEPGWRCRVPGKKCLPLVDAGDDHAVCGDGIVAELEECDCGDGTIPFPPGCGSPNDDEEYGGCTTHCLYGMFCGDGEVNGPEECDLGRLNGKTSGKDGCTLGCTKTHYCGDGILDTHLLEECDLGDLNGRKLGADLKPLTVPDDGRVYCTRDCRIPLSAGM